MDNSLATATCPSCGFAFVPPEGLSRCFCPACGATVGLGDKTSAQPEVRTSAQPGVRPDTQTSAQQLAQTIDEQGERAVKVGEDATQQALEALRRAQEAEGVDEATAAAIAAAFEAARRGMEAARAAEAAQMAQAEYAHLFDEQQRAWEREQEAWEQQRREREAREQAAREQVAREQAAREQAAREQAARAQAAREARARQAQAASKPTYRTDAVVRDEGGRGLFVVTIPEGWSLRNTSLTRTGNSSKPYKPYASFTNGDGCNMTLGVGDAGVRLSDGMKAMMATYGASLATVDQTNYGNMPNPILLADNYVLSLTKRVCATDLFLVREWQSPDLVARQHMVIPALKETDQSSGGIMLKDPFVAEVMRIYEYVLNGELRNIAVYVRVYAAKAISGLDYTPIGLAGSLGGAIGGMFARKRKRAARDDSSGPAHVSDAPIWCLPGFDAYQRGGSIAWDVCGFLTLDTPADVFDRQFDMALLPLVRSYELHADVKSIAAEVGRQQAAASQQVANREIAANNARTQATLAAAREARAAQEARFASWQAQSDAHHAAFRERTNAEFRGSGSGGGVGDFSEAIRGVNTFVTSDGREVELSIYADRAYENQAGDVVGGSDGFDPGADWTEIPRA